MIELSMIKTITACNKLDHHGSVAATLNMKKFDHTELDDYVLTRKEYAESVGISPNAVRMRQRHGKLDGQYRYDGNKFLFKVPDRPRDYIVNDHSKNIKLTTPKKKYNRGNHFKADYPNESFKNYNELKMFNKIKKNLPDRVLNEINPEVIKVAEERARKRQDDLLKKSFTQPKNYGGPVSTMPRYDIEAMKSSFYNANQTPRNYQYYEVGNNQDDGSVEVNISGSSATHNSEPHFANAVEEAIWRNKNKKY